LATLTSAGSAAVSGWRTSAHSGAVLEQARHDVASDLGGAADHEDRAVVAHAGPAWSSV
jgi:hypothetical protein